MERYIKFMMNRSSIRFLRHTTYHYIVNRISKFTEHKVFQSVVYIKGIFGVLEAAAGILLLIVDSKSLSRLVEWVFGQELLEDPHDFFGNFFMHIAKNLSLKMHVFFGIYMLVHGIVHIAIVFALIHKKLWAFPVAGIVLSLFVVYQIYSIIHSFSILIIVLTIIDLIILSLLKFEYDRLKRINY